MRVKVTSRTAELLDGIERLIAPHARADGKPVPSKPEIVEAAVMAFVRANQIVVAAIRAERAGAPMH